MASCSWVDNSLDGFQPHREAHGRLLKARIRRLAVCTIGEMLFFFLRVPVLGGWPALRVGRPALALA
jgi:hypothetical protein